MYASFKRKVTQFICLIAAPLLVIYCVTPENELDVTANQRLSVSLIEGLPTLGKTKEGYPIQLGAFSGLDYLGLDPKTGLETYVSVTDRGPNSHLSDYNKDGKKERIFALPDYQPEIVIFGYNSDSGKAQLVNRIPITAPTRHTSGVPDHKVVNDPNKQFEGAVDQKLETLTPDPLGVDPEDIVADKSGDFWIVEEYHPSLLQVDKNGKIKNRYLPMANKKSFDFEHHKLPAIFSRHRANRGFEGLAIQGDKLYLFVQSPLEARGPNYRKKKYQSRFIRILEFDKRLARTTGQYLYKLEIGHWKKTKIGAASAAKNANQFFVSEADGKKGKVSMKNIYLIDIANATNLMETLEYKQNPDYDFEDEASQLLGSKFKPVDKKLVTNLTAFGYIGPQKVEGLAMGPGNSLAIVNDNDFGVHGKQHKMKKGKSASFYVQKEKYDYLSYFSKLYYD